ncbi:SDR family oxidoreductase [Amycolatopsis acidicola]|uniref:SDR family oxidoreductase n=1 Tax=Amycolatopsis acidicola TaxID=2596893 RepID=A0A5N0VLP7_9PSEU|nr:SDR family oxidoreductase [Amycolatopsis acidicola]KAA9166463.1 SDR family oxidoreductase [Amycolatopsis acidicola]
MALLEGQSVIITGAARGMGEATARRAVAEGAAVVLVDLDPAVTGLAAELGGESVVGSVADPDCAERAVAAAAGVTGLVNVAGVFRLGDVVTASDTDWDELLAINLTAPRIWARAVIPAMIARGGGAIVNFASLAGTRARPNCVAYTTAKTGLLGLTRSIAIDYGPQGIRANSISPGTIDSPMLRGSEAAGGTTRAEHIALNYLPRLGTPGEVAGCCCFLLSPDAGFVNGADFMIDGGRTAGT